MLDNAAQYLKEKIGDFQPEENSLVYDLDEQYLLPGLIDLHSYLALDGSPKNINLEKKAKRFKFLLSNPLTKRIAFSLSISPNTCNKTY